MGRPNEKAVLLGERADRDEEIRKETEKEPSRPTELGQGPQTPQGQGQGKAQRNEKKVQGDKEANHSDKQRTSETGQLWTQRAPVKMEKGLWDRKPSSGMGRGPW